MVEGAAHFDLLFYTLNIDLIKGERITLGDIVNINDDFRELLINGHFEPLIESKSEHINLESITIDSLLRSDYGSLEGERNNMISCYLKDVSLVISIPTIFSLGDHAKYEIKFNQIPESLRVKHHIWGMIYTISDVPIFALATVMTDQVEERTSLITYGRLAALLASLLAMGLFMPIVQATNWTVGAIIMMTLAFLFMVPIRFFAVERIKYDREEAISMKDIFTFIKSNKPLITYYISFLLMGMSNTVLISGAYFAKYIMGDENLIGVFGITGMLPLLFIIPFLPLLIRKFGKRNIFIFSAMVGIASNLLFFFVGYGNLVQVIVLNSIRTITSFMPMMMMGMFSADFVEYGYYKTGKRAEGISFSVQTFATKFSQAIGAVIGGFLLGDVFGFVANTELSDATIDGIFAMYSWIPATGIILGLIVFYFGYKLKESDVQKMIEEMQEGK